MKKALLVLALVSTATYTAWTRLGGEAPVRAADKSLTLDRIWIDHLPKNDRDQIHVFAALTEQPVGIFQKVSQWQGAYEVFMFEHHGDQLRVHFPQTGDREKLTAKARACDEGAMDYCLELSGSSRGVKRYYSMKGWELDGVRDADALGLRAGAVLDQLTTR